MKNLRESFRSLTDTKRAHIWQSLATYIQQGFGFLLGILLARLLTPADFGLYTFAIAILSIAMLPTTWSLAPLLISDGNKTEKLFEQVMGFTWRIILFKILITLGLFAYFIGSQRETIAWICLIVGCADAFREISMILMSDLQGRGNFKSNFYAEVVTMACTFPLAIAAALAGWGPYSLLVPAVCSLVCYLMVFFWTNPKSILKTAPQGELSKHLPAGFSLWLNNMAQVVFTRIDNWFVGKYFGLTPLGNYNRAYNYAPVTHTLLNSFLSNVTVSALARTKTVQAKKNLFLKTAIVVLGAGAINAAVLFFYSDPLVVWIFGEQWRDAIPIFRDFAPLSLCWAILYLPVVLLFASKRFRVTGIVRLIACVILGLSLFLGQASLTIHQIAILIQALIVLQGLVLMILAWPELSKQMES
jgi:O-antigen/teichoic acid export membrane protein